MAKLYFFLGCARFGGMSSMDAALRYWEDYLTAAEAMGYQLHRENVLLPKARPLVVYKPSFLNP